MNKFLMKGRKKVVGGEDVFVLEVSKNGEVIKKEEYDCVDNLLIRSGEIYGEVSDEYGLDYMKDEFKFDIKVENKIDW